MNNVEHETEQKTAIVTGASRGIGHAVAERFRSLGWRVITVSRSPIPLGCPRSAEHNTHFCMDLSDLSQIGQMVDMLRPMLPDGKLHALVNNAGVSPKGPGGSRVNSLTTDMQTWQAMYNTNFFAPLALTRGFAQELSNAAGSVVNLCSIAGYRVHPFAGSAYASSKAALASLTRWVKGLPPAASASGFGPGTRSGNAQRAPRRSLWCCRPSPMGSRWR